MLQFMGDNKRLLNLHEQNLYELEAFKSNTQIFQTNTSWAVGFDLVERYQECFP